MATRIKITKTGATPGVMRRQAGKMAAKSFLVAGAHWGIEIRPKHFTQAGAIEYGYKPRTRGYRAKKVAAVGHNLPLVYTGESKEASEDYRLRSTAFRGRVTMPTPRINWSGRADELTTTSRADNNEIADAWAGEYQARIRAFKGKQDTSTT